MFREKSRGPAHGLEVPRNRDAAQALGGQLREQGGGHVEVILSTSFARVNDLAIFGLSFVVDLDPLTAVTATAVSSHGEGDYGISGFALPTAVA